MNADKPAPSTTWTLEVHRDQGQDSLLLLLQFDAIAAMREAMMQHQGRRFIIVPPAVLTTRDHIALLHLRADGFLLEIKTR